MRASRSRSVIRTRLGETAGNVTKDGYASSGRVAGSLPEAGDWSMFSINRSLINRVAPLSHGCKIIELKFVIE